MMPVRKEVLPVRKEVLCAKKCLGLGLGKENYTQPRATRLSTVP